MPPTLSDRLATTPAPKATDQRLDEAETRLGQRIACTAIRRATGFTEDCSSSSCEPFVEHDHYSRLRGTFREENVFWAAPSVVRGEDRRMRASQ
jgi:hypothetical protein